MMSRTILIADDHAVLRQLLQTQLKEWFADLDIVEAEDGEHAVAVAAEIGPDVVIMDLDLPGMSGIEATRAIKKLQPDTRIVVLTVHELEAYQAGAAEAGADAYIAKRHIQSKLRDVLTRMLAELPSSSNLSTPGS
jgi:DNA-binding NarL/FixJ family response regulator